MSLVAAKWISSIILFSTTLAFSIIPVIAFNYFSKRKIKRNNKFNIKETNTLNISKTNSQNHRCANLSATSDDNESITGSGENVIRRTRSNSIGSIASIGSRKMNKKSAATLQCFMFFGGGILLATCLCHLLPEIKENFEKYSIKNSNHSHDHPHDHSHDSNEHSHEDPINYKPPLTSSEDSSAEVNTGFSNIDTTSLTPTLSPNGLINYKRNSSDNPIASPLHASHDDEEMEEDDNEHNHGGHSHNHGIPWVEIAVCSGFFIIYLIEEIVHLFVDNHKHSFNDHNTTYKVESIDEIRWDLPYQSKSDSDTHLVYNNSNKKLPCYDNYAIDFNSEPRIARESENKREASTEIATRQSSLINQTAIEIKDEKLLPSSVRFMQGFVTIVAFSAHSIFDGLAIGLQNNNTAVYTTLFSISMHKFVVSFAIGLELYDQTSSVIMTVIHMTLFSIMSPFGIWISIFSESASDVPSEESLFFIILSAIATGTIIYIVFFEVLQKDRESNNNVNGIFLWFIMVFGFTLMILINSYIPMLEKLLQKT